MKNLNRKDSISEKLKKLNNSYKNWCKKEPITDMSKSDLYKLINNVIEKKVDEINDNDINNHAYIFKGIKIFIVIIISILSIDPISNLLSNYYQDNKNKETIINLNNVAKNMYFKEYAPKIALKIIDKSLDINEQNAETIYIKSFIESMEVVEELKNLDRPYNYDELQKAHLALANAEFILESDEKVYYPNAYLVKAQTYYALNEIDKSIYFIDKAINQNPLPFYKIRKSTILIETGNENKDLKKIDLGLVILNELEKNTENENLKWVYLYKAIALTYKIQLDDKINKNELLRNIDEYYQKALKIDGKFHLALFNYAKFYQDISDNENRIKESIKYYKMVLNILPDNKEVYYQLAKLYGNIDKYEKSIVYLNKALEIDNNYFSANFLKAKVLYEEKKFNETLEFLNKAIKINPNNFEVFLVRGETYIQLKDSFNAEKDFFEIINNIETKNIQDENILIDAYLYLSDMYISQNKLEKANEKINEIEKYKVYDYSEYYKVKFKYFKETNNIEEALKYIDYAIEYSRDNKTKNILEKIDFLIEINDCKKAQNSLKLINEQKENFDLRNKIEEIETTLKNCND